MPIKEINKNIKKLQNESFNCSKLIIQLRVENLDDLKSKKKLFYLESQSKKIIEKLKILNLKKNIIKKKKNNKALHKPHIYNIQSTIYII